MIDRNTHNRINKVIKMKTYNTLSGECCVGTMHGYAYRICHHDGMEICQKGAVRRYCLANVRQRQTLGF